MPIIITGNRLNYKSTIFYVKGNKKSSTDLQCPVTSIKTLQGYSKEYNFTIKNLEDFDYNLDVLFVIDGVRLENINLENRKFKIINIAYILMLKNGLKCMHLVDKNIYFNEETLINSIHDYIEKKEPDKTIKNACKFINKYKDKNVFLRRCLYLNRKEIMKKYKINSDKIITFFLPTIRYKEVNLKQLKFIFNQFKDYFFILKSRSKDDYPKKIKEIFPKNSIYVNDIEWYPHPSLEFIFISNFVIMTWNTLSSFETIELNKRTIILKSQGMVTWATKVSQFLGENHPLCTLVTNTGNLKNIDISNLENPKDELIIENKDIFDLINSF